MSQMDFILRSRKSLVKVLKAKASIAFDPVLRLVKTKVLIPFPYRQKRQMRKWIRVEKIIRKYSSM